MNILLKITLILLASLSVMGQVRTDTIKVVINAYPAAPSVNGATIVVGNYTTLNASGCNGSYLWSTGAISQSITVNPTNYTEYKVRCIQNACQGPEATAIINVISPNSEVWAGLDKICKGEMLSTLSSSS